jgi:hypothetical protein
MGNFASHFLIIHLSINYFFVSFYSGTIVLRTMLAPTTLCFKLLKIGLKKPHFGFIKSVGNYRTNW